mgnify:CR=1 FL=1
MKSIIGYEGLYTIDKDGNVYGLSRKKYLKPDIDKRTHTNYHRITLSSRGKIKKFLVHRLVAICYIPNPLNKPHVNHIDNIGTNNNVSNLEWVTHAENMMHSEKQGRQDSPRILGGLATAKINKVKTENKLKNILENNFIYTEVKDNRTLVKYYCPICKKEDLVRVDSEKIKIHKGVCKKCR